MFFFIGGIQPKTIRADKQAKLCSVCGHPGVYLKRVDHYLSVFFIPLFPVKKGTPFLICENCCTKFDDRGEREELWRRGCPNCGNSVDQYSSFCPNCGKAL